MFGTYGKLLDLEDVENYRLDDNGVDAWSELHDYLKAWRK